MKECAKICVKKCKRTNICVSVSAMLVDTLTLLESFYFHKTTQNRSQKYKKTALKHTFSQYSSTQFLLNLALVDSFYYFFLRLGFMGNQPFSTRFF